MFWGAFSADNVYFILFISFYYKIKKKKKKIKKKKKKLEIERLITSMVMSDKLRKIENLKIKRNYPKTCSDNFK